MSQLGIAAKARYFGIPNPTVTWPVGGATKLEIFTSVKKTPMADVAESKDNQGERQSSNDTNHRIQLQFSGYPIGAAAANALAIAADLPLLNSLVTIACAGDAEVATPAGGCSVVDSVDVDYTPEGEAVVNMTVTNWIGKVFVALA